MLSCFFHQQEATMIPVIPLTEVQHDDWLSKQDTRIKHWAKAVGFKAKSGSVALYCNADGFLEKVLVGMGQTADYRVFGQLAGNLPKGYYYADIEHYTSAQRYQVFLAWGMGSYQYTPYKKQSPLEARLFLPETEPRNYLEAVLRAIYLVRDLVNTPADDMAPADLAEAATILADEFSGKVTQIIGEELLEHNYPAIHTVGRASNHAPRLIDLRWGNVDHPKITIVGKGVCFDSGGLNIKGASNMVQMKKDMAGGAHALGIAHVVMALKLPVCLRVLIPAVENAVSGDAYHPGDVIITRKGTTVEITNTDAEGRVILSDALWEATSEQPALLLDFCTLTGAARVALGTEIGALFTPDDTLATELTTCASEENDPLWRLPLYAPYKKLLDSKIADMTNATSAPYGGAITAALFLQEFVSPDISWAHFDVMAWNNSSKPALPEGGEAHGLRAVARYLFQRFGR